MVNTAYGKRLDDLILMALFVSVVIALLVVPIIPPPSNTDVISAAAAVGYSTPAAFWTVLAWSALAIFIFALPGLKRLLGMDSNNIPTINTINTYSENWQPGKLIWGELLGVFLLFTLAYLPLFLARHGPYMEDTYFLVALQRMACGQLPYADFAFLYGPLMIFPLWEWSQIFDTSMVSYFGFLSLVEGLQFTILMAVLQYIIPERRKRYWVFLLLLPFLFNTLLGLNYNGMRRLVPALAMVLVAYRPYDRKANVASAFILGFQLAYSHEYAIAALVGVTGIYAVAFLRGERTAAVWAASVISLISILVWAAITALTLGVDSTLSAYFGLVAEVVEMMSRGHAGFRFYWTANSLALFGLLTIALGAIGKGLFPARQKDMLAGDRLLLGAALCAIVMLKSGLTRSDLWHLNAGFLTLFIAFLLPFPSQAMAIIGAQRKVAMGLLIVASVTYLVGIAPTGSLYATSYIRGFIDTLSTRNTTFETRTQNPSIEFERTQPRAHFVAMNRYLAAPIHSKLPVLFYGRAWTVAPLVGVCSEDYKLDDLMYSEFYRPESIYLKQHPNALIVIHTDDYKNLYGLRRASESSSRLDMTPTKLLGQWLSTVHYDAADVEGRLQEQARERLTGKYLPLTHKRVTQFGDYVILSPL